MINKYSSSLKFIFSYLFLIGAFLFLTSCEGKKTIVYGLDQNEANEILVFLSSKGIDAEKSKSEDSGGGGGQKITLWDVAVKTPDANEAMRELNKQGLPRRRTQSILGIFSTGGLVSSDLEQKIKYRAALAEQLASTIRKYEGILDAEVHVSFPEEDPLNPGKSRGKITASVWIKHSGVLDDPNPHLVTKIRRFVSSSITGLNVDDVSVVWERSRYGEASDMGASFEEAKQYVNLWSIVVAKESASRFRWIFFSFCILLLLMALSLVWLLWKLLPVLARHGGIKGLFSIKPLVAHDDKDKIEEAPVEKAKEDTKGGPNTKINKDIDET
ncbi:MAG: type III secretion inner membrane ring lipoprotein SctJ [Parachlamydiaceae bacterium]|nr:type III secretion inner membrane ring lipoprotein SctJ [Parachlamydiaceae bacterium]